MLTLCMLSVGRCQFIISLSRKGPEIVDIIGNFSLVSQLVLAAGFFYRRHLVTLDLASMAFRGANYSHLNWTHRGKRERVS